MKNAFYFLLSVLLFSTCGDDDINIDPYDAELALEIVTGLQTRDINGAPIGALGNPNAFSGEVDIYPNPAIGSANIQYFGGLNLQVKQYWIFAAPQNTDYADINYQTLLSNETYSADEVSDLNIVQTNTVNLSAFAIDLSAFAAGYYRIFYLMSDDRLLWDNIYVDPSAATPALLLNDITGDW